MASPSEKLYAPGDIKSRRGIITRRLDMPVDKIYGRGHLRFHPLRPPGKQILPKTIQGLPALSFLVASASGVVLISQGTSFRSLQGYARGLVHPQGISYLPQSAENSRSPLFGSPFYQPHRLGFPHLTLSIPPTRCRSLGRREPILRRISFSRLILLAAHLLAYRYPGSYA